MSDAKEKLDDLGILPDTILVIVNDNGEFVDLIIKGKPRWGGFQIAEGRGTFKENLGTWYIDTDECYFSNLPDSKEEQLSRFW